MRNNGSDKVHERSFDVGIRETIVDMWENTKLVLIDVPGINEAESNGKFKDFVRDKWDTFDCVVVVMDGTQGANSDEQLNFLEFLHSNNQEIRDVETIILCNKVDNPSNEDILEVVNELKERVEAIYGVSDRTEAFQGLLEGATVQDPFPIFLPFSAMHAFIY